MMNSQEMLYVVTTLTPVVILLVAMMYLYKSDKPAIINYLKTAHSNCDIQRIELANPNMVHISSTLWTLLPRYYEVSYKFGSMPNYESKIARRTITGKITIHDNIFKH